MFSCIFFCANYFDTIIYLNISNSISMSDQELIEQLQKVNPKTVKAFSFDGYECYGRVVRVHDPDTITVLFHYHDTICKTNLRLNGIDAPELHSKIQKEADLCKAGQKFLSSMILDKIIKIKMESFEKFGRTLANIYTYDTEEDIIQKLIDGGFVRAYDGGKKVEWTDLELQN